MIACLRAETPVNDVPRTRIKDIVRAEIGDPKLAMPLSREVRWQTRREIAGSYG